ncbi:SDR family oxidoreductase [Rhodobacterales bacterium HKCCE2091]|nr:SDR family oxidoreductase [Rhodobacterales bacterium HKCCE2091]
MDGISGKVVVLTGAGRGIGRAAALLLARSGARVVVNDIDPEVAGAVCDEIAGEGGEAVPAIAAIGSAEAADTCVDAALSAFGRMDAIVCNAGILRDRVLWNTTDEDFDAVVATHLRGTFTCARAAARHFRGAEQAGRIILVGSIAGQRGNFGQTAYSAAKAGIAAMARTWSMELARANVAVNAVIPNALTRMVATIPQLAPFVEMHERGEPLPDTVRADLGMGGPEDVAPLIAFLASDASEGISGQCIGIGGDRLSIWSHPAEKAHLVAAGGWTLEDLAGRGADMLRAELESVGVKLDL